MFIPQPDPGLLGVFVLLALHLCAVYTALGAFPLTVVCELFSRSGGKVFHKKLAQQFSALGVLFLVYMLFAVGGSMAFLYFQYPDLIHPWLDAPMAAAPLAGAVAWLTVLGLAYALGWGWAKSSPGGHVFLGLLAALGTPALLALSLAVKLIVLSGRADMLATGGLGALLAAGAAHPLFAPLALSCLLLTLACAGGFGLVFLILRRGRDDFGRDYYAFAARFTARWAALSMACALAAQAWVFALTPEMLYTGTELTFPGWLATTGNGCGLVAILAWVAVARSSRPLRSKPAMFLAALLLICAVGALSAVDTVLFFPAQP
ncbi:hypothetical protein [Desulfocurvus sp. DL9XJH121]